MLLSPMNMNSEPTQRTLDILNHIALAFSFGSLFVDTVKMVFISDYSFDLEAAAKISANSEF